MQVTIQQLQAIAKTAAGKKAAEEFAPILNELFPKFNLNEPAVIAAFIAQAMHESAEFTRLTESFNYSPEVRLFNTFTTRFKTIQIAKNYFGKPEAIANFVYANRMGNGSEESGDGWRYRGRGVIQLTGKNNYVRFNEHAEQNIIENPDLVASNKELALRSACWFWEKNNLNQFADNKDFRELTRRINGGYNGLEDREKYYALALEHL